jgi:energy-coupling factor transporter ATP-binding protein EcfA2
MEKLGRMFIAEGIITENQVNQALERQKHQGGRLGENLIALGFITEKDVESVFSSKPIPPKTVEETGLDLEFIAELVLKHSLFMGEFKMSELAERIKLPLAVISDSLDLLRRDRYLEVKGGSGYAATTYTFKTTESGKNYGTELLHLCHYVGPAPVTLDDYQAMVRRQTVKSILIPEEDVKQGFSHLIVRKNVLELIGPAISSGKAIFVYGPPGNGKTAIAETVGRLLPDTVYIPYALTVGGQIISIFDPVSHTPVEPEHPTTQFDQRWSLIKRPVVMTGGELAMKRLDLEFNPVSKHYEASLQMKANNGLFIVDDFGRQQIEPRQLLNRWIVPLDKGIDFMTLHTGMKFSIPFDMVVIFATNLDPAKLVDEAFLRRIQYKIRIDQPNEVEFRAIFNLECAGKGIAFVNDSLDYLIDNYYKALRVDFNACHPRDLIDHIVVRARYYHRKPELTKENLDAAWSCYYVQLNN